MKIKYIKANNNSVVNVAGRDQVNNLLLAEILKELKKIHKQIKKGNRNADATSYQSRNTKN